jgi:putative transposase
MCRVLKVHRSGYHAWLHCPQSCRQIEDERLLGLIKQFWLESGCVYGYRTITMDMKESREPCGKNRVHRIMRAAGIQSNRGYKRHPGFKGGKPAHVAPNVLDRDFTASQPNQAWVTDFTFIRTYEGWLYLCVVLDLFSRQVIGWSMTHRPRAELVINALLMAVWRRQPTGTVLVHSDQGVQYTSDDWQRFLKENNLEISMSRKGNCHDNAVAESFFSLLKTERIKRQIYKTRNDARADIFNYIEMFYNPKRRHGTNNQLSPMEYEKRYYREAANCLQN